MVVIVGKNGRYEILGQFGKGGQATVYQAKNLDQPGTIYALKVVHFRGLEIEAVYDGESYQRYHWEYLLTAKLNHPQISTATDYGVDEDAKVVFMARPYVEGPTLTKVLNRKKLIPIADGYRIILSLAGVLDYIHSHNIIHCDLKPSNIIMKFNDPILIDFGLVAGEDSPAYMIGGTTGTRSYLAPEILDFELRDEFRYSPSRDWWGLGCIAFGIFTGKRLFKNTETKVIREKINRGFPLKAIQKVLDGHPGKPLVTALLERDPNKRISSKLELQKIGTYAPEENNHRSWHLRSQ